MRSSIAIVLSPVSSVLLKILNELLLISLLLTVKLSLQRLEVSCIIAILSHLRLNFCLHSNVIEYLLQGIELLWVKHLLITKELDLLGSIQEVLLKALRGDDLA